MRNCYQLHFIRQRWATGPFSLLDELSVQSDFEFHFNYLGEFEANWKIPIFCHKIMNSSQVLFSIGCPAQMIRRKFYSMSTPIHFVLYFFLKNANFVWPEKHVREIQLRGKVCQILQRNIEFAQFTSNSSKWRKTNINLAIY